MLHKEFLRYLVAGGLAFLIDFSLLYLCTEWFGIHYLLSNLIGYGGGFLVAYLLNVKWVFKYRRFTYIPHELGIFLLIALSGILLNEFVLYLLVENEGFNYLLAKIFATGMVFVFNFVARKYFLFSKSPSQETDAVSESG